jgi:hypothetical protein
MLDHRVQNGHRIHVSNHIHGFDSKANKPFLDVRDIIRAGVACVTVPQFPVWQLGQHLVPLCKNPKDDLQ